MIDGLATDFWWNSPNDFCLICANKYRMACDGFEWAINRCKGFLSTFGLNFVGHSASLTPLLRSDDSKLFSDDYSQINIERPKHCRRRSVKLISISIGCVCVLGDRHTRAMAYLYPNKFCNSNRLEWDSQRHTTAIDDRSAPNWIRGPNRSYDSPEHTAYTMEILYIFPVCYGNRLHRAWPWVWLVDLFRKQRNERKSCLLKKVCADDTMWYSELCYNAREAFTRATILLLTTKCGFVVFVVVLI